ncbi:MAG: restriction endonuclease subunit S [Candidatus Gracilibacteria bacterium]|nr:restriction endonuclease subunit S [Candidatus Gracilibacteria bacterium]
MIHLVDERNRGFKTSLLLGLTISKKFIPSVANIIGTDMENYKIIRKNQFACSLMQVRRDKKIPIALMQDFEEAIISQAYPVFEVNSENELLPEYLMMWFSREEFDREACFYAVGGVRGSLEWEDFCNMELPVPDITKQQEIVDEYHVIKNRIRLNTRLIEKLEETAQAVYREWFVDFEFSDENGNPYKSSGGEMEFCSELKKEVPKGWSAGKIKDFVVDMKNGATPLRDKIEYWNSNDIPWLKTGEIHNNILVSAEEYISKKGFKNSSTKILPVNTVLMAMYGVTAGQVGFLKFEATTNQACCAMISKNINHASYLYYFLLSNQEEIASMANGGAQANLSKNLIEELIIILPDEEALRNSNLSVLVDFWHKKTLENENLGKIKDLILSKMASRS